MTLRILVKLPPLNMRQKPGTLRLVDDATGADLVTCDCLGKADNAAAAASHNPARDPVEENGDTPSGTYAAAKALPIPPSDPNHAHMGDWFIPLIGISGDAARAKSNGRRGLAIHAGRDRHPDGSLVVTHGCLRIGTPEMQMIADILAGRQVDEIAIDEGLTHT